MNGSEKLVNKIRPSRNEKAMFLGTLIVYVSEKYEEIVEELLNLQMSITYYASIVETCGDIQSSIESYEYSPMYRGQPQLKICGEIYKKIELGLSKENANNLFNAVNYFMLKDEIKKNIAERGKLKDFLVYCQLHINGLLANLERIHMRENHFEKLIILKGILVYY